MSCCVMGFTGFIGSENFLPIPILLDRDRIGSDRVRFGKHWLRTPSNNKKLKKSQKPCILTLTFDRIEIMSSYGYQTMYNLILRRLVPI